MPPEHDHVSLPCLISRPTSVGSRCLNTEPITKWSSAVWGIKSPPRLSKTLVSQIFLVKLSNTGSRPKNLIPSDIIYPRFIRQRREPFSQYLQSYQRPGKLQPAIVVIGSRKRDFWFLLRKVGGLGETGALSRLAGSIPPPTPRRSWPCLVYHRLGTPRTDRSNDRALA